jgi:hypothetical protein
MAETSPQFPSESGLLSDLNDDGCKVMKRPFLDMESAEAIIQNGIICR